MQVFNTLARDKQELVPLTAGEYKIYVCGPTVYNYIHIGNARPICVFDVLRRYLEYRGDRVTYVQNFTDVEDKLIRRANEENTTVPALAEKYIGEYLVDAAGLNVRPATLAPKATENIEEIITFISILCDKGYAYASGGDVYFRAKRFKDYGKLSRQPLEELEAGARVDVSEQKEEAVDFALWKSAKPGEPAWDSPWGPGRPGWHIECSAMAKRYLGDTIDIHCGGQDLIFPHHENEIAQSECANDTEFARYFMHNGYINIDNHKMSKSAGNFFTVREVAEQVGYEPIRYIMIASHYRSPMNYSLEVLDQAKASLERLYTFRGNLDFWMEKPGDANPGQGLGERADGCRAAFEAEMDNDLNTAGAIGAIFELVREVNTAVTERGASKEELAYVAGVFDELVGVLGLLYNREAGDLDSGVEAMIQKRAEARANKDFAAADAIRDQLKDMGIVLEDTPQGVKWYKA